MRAGKILEEGTDIIAQFAIADSGVAQNISCQNIEVELGGDPELAVIAQNHHHPSSRTRRPCCYRQREPQESNRRVANLPLSRRASSRCIFPRSPQERIDPSLKPRLSLFHRAIT